MPDDFVGAIDCRDGTRAELNAALAADDIGEIEIQCETDTGRFKVGARYVSGRHGAVVTFSVAGNTTLRPRADLARALFIVRPTAGAAGAYIHNLIIGRLGNNPMSESGETEAMLPYDQVALRVEQLATANPTVRIYDNDTSGTLLLTIAPDVAVARDYYVLLYRTEAGAWAVEFAAQSAAVNLP